MSYDNQSELYREQALTSQELLLRERLGRLRSAVSTINYYRIGEEDREVVRRDSVVKSLEDARQPHEVVDLNSAGSQANAEPVNPVPTSTEYDDDFANLRENALKLMNEAFEEAA